MKHVLECTGNEMLITDLEKAEGYYLFDSKGKKYIDFESGVWSMALGHNNQQINEAIKKQIDKIMHLGFRYTNGLVEAAAINVIRTLKPFSGKCLFLSSGSEAVEVSVKMAKTISNGKKLLTFRESYLSAYGMSGNKDDSEWIKLEISMCRDCSNNYNCGKCKVIEDIPFQKVGVFVFEPGNSSGLMLIPPKNLIYEIAKRMKENNGLIVIDEVTTGVGRTGKWYGFQHFTITPDLIALGKGIGNGYPVSVVVVEDKIAKKIEMREFRHSQSHQNDALGCVVVSEVINFIEQNNLIETSNKNGQYFFGKLNELKEKSKVIKEVRGSGMMIAIEFENKAKAVLESLNEHLIKKGFLVGYKPIYNLMRFYPSLTTNKEDIDSIIACIKDCLL
ncbi:MAG TPA: aminotransferase class III [Firmicutes bacterium]|jgi:acetylornithine aminotransferase|nr:aminotransferase class III [Bacillota bacterium]HBT16003.1 aminotransferase class III [Bacillota bacterium]